MASMFNKSNHYNNGTNRRKGACFSVTMPYQVEKRLREIQNDFGLNSRSQTIVFLVHYYDREKQAFETIERFSKMLENIEIVENNHKSDIAKQVELPYNKTN